MHSQIPLTPRQDQILTLLLQRGASNKTIGNLLDITESTVKVHISKILRKYGARNRTQLIVFINAREGSDYDKQTTNY
jgi:DNA-binding NarL/FixJ family response regulator